MTPVLSYDELAVLIKARAGIQVDPMDLERPGASFDEFGIDSLGLLGVVGELENRHGVQIPADAVTHKTPADFVAAVNSAVKAGA
ncbi:MULTISPECIES: acyl carrier protein [Kitasatospora]|uniref:Minimal PKS acyl carrier protein n=2 Tax=Kitasatospora TaxID=2063 RepID=A0ABT1J8T6_9ACTN|nr:acyl carrier protein [Kitasatospora paracochleata]MCP2313513.1 minimal PKS acyl carrier protein [Kitasatospora paracochleata]